MADDKPRRDESDPLYLNSVYPEPSAIFEFSPKPLRETLKAALFVLDTNALLVPYGTDPASLDAIQTTYTRLIQENRLVVPAQAAREFAKNRPERLKIVYDQLAKLQNLSVAASEYPLLAELPAYQAMKKVEGELASNVKEYRAAIKNVLNQIRGWYWDDPVSAMYRVMFTDKVVVDVKLTEDEVRRDMTFRQAHKVPPGYKDAGASGDLIIWKTILALGRDRKNHLVFVSGEEKADWWYRASEGVLYPRFELLDEYRRASEGHTFHIVPLADVLAVFGARQEVVDAVREEEAALKPITRPTASWGDLAVNAVKGWLSQQGVVTEDPSTGYLVLHRADGLKVNVEVRLVHRRDLAEPKMRSAVSGALAREAVPYLLILVGRTLASTLPIRSKLAIDLQSRPLPQSGIEVQIGYLLGENFKPLLKRLWPLP